MKRFVALEGWFWGVSCEENLILVVAHSGEELQRREYHGWNQGSETKRMNIKVCGNVWWWGSGYDGSYYARLCEGVMVT